MHNQQSPSPRRNTQKRTPSVFSFQPLHGLLLVLLAGLVVGLTPQLRKVVFAAQLTNSKDVAIGDTGVATALHTTDSSPTGAGRVSLSSQETPTKLPSSDLAGTNPPSAKSAGVSPSLRGTSQTTPPTAAAATTPDSAPAAPSPRILALVQEAQVRLARRKSIQADVKTLVQFGEQTMVATGRYEAEGLKLRLSTTLKLKSGVAGELLEVCDGETLWSRTVIDDMKRYTRRDVRQILNAGASGGTAETLMLSELGLGGLPGIMASIQRCMQFTAMKPESTDDGPVYRVQGEWKPDFPKKWFAQKPTGDMAYFPDVIRITYAADTLFPTRLLYLKRVQGLKPGEETGLRPILSMEFENVMLDEPLDDQTFEFIPADGVIPDDVTKQYLERIFAAKPRPALAAEPRKE